MLNLLLPNFDISSYNFILACDSYKIMHHAQLKKGIKKMFSSIVPRKSCGNINELVVAGPRIVAKILSRIVITDAMIDEAEEEIQSQGYDFPREKWEYIRDLGYLPLSVRAIPEGTVVPAGVSIADIVNTDEVSAWLVGYIETWVQDIIWCMSTVASKVRFIYKQMLAFCKATGTSLEHLEYMIHNFGDRGAGGEDRAIMAAMAHAMFFSGSDCTRVNRFIRAAYDIEESITMSIDAAEHSTVCSNSDCDNRDDFGGFQMSLDMLARAVKRSSNGIGIPVISCLIDTFDDERFVKDFVVKHYDDITQIGGKYVCRPDSGNAIEKPIEVVIWLRDGVLARNKAAITSALESGIKVLDTLHDKLVNEAGFKVLPENLGVIQGDGLRLMDFGKIAERAIQEGLAASCFVFGFGGGLTNGSGRDDFSFSMKANSQMLADGTWEDLIKDPKTDLGKRSFKGRVSTWRDQNDVMFTDRIDLIKFNPNIEEVTEVILFNSDLRNSAANDDFFDVRANATI